MKRILITGGAGFIGSHCVDRFLREGYEIGVFDILPRKDAVNLAHTLEHITYIEGDVRNVRELQSVMDMYDTVLHLAAVVSVPESLKAPIDSHGTNVTGTLHVFESAAKSTPKRVVYASSAAVYGDTKSVPTREDEVVAPLSPYGLHKVINEQHGALYNRIHGLETIGLRFFNVYGSRQDPTSPYSGVISIFSERMKRGESPVIFGSGEATRDFVHVSDVAAACVAAVEAPVSDALVCNVGRGESATLLELVSAINTALGTNISAVHKEPRQGDIVHSCSDASLAKRRLTFQSCTKLHEGLMETLRV